MASTAIKLVGGMSAKDASAFAREMGCEEGFLQERRKDQTHTELACFIRNRMKHPTVLDVPLGLKEGEPRARREGAGGSVGSQSPAHLRGGAPGGSSAGRPEGSCRRLAGQW